MTKDFYQTVSPVCVAHDGLYFHDQAHPSFRIHDASGKHIAVAYTAQMGRKGNQTGWFASMLDGSKAVGPFSNRAQALSALLGEKKIATKPEITFKQETAVSSAKTILPREVALVRPNPMAAFRMNLNTPSKSPSLWGYVGCALIQGDLDGNEHALIPEEHPDGFSALQVAEGMGLIPENRTIVSADVFEMFLSVYTSSMNTIDNVRVLAGLIEEHVPAFRFMPRHLVPVLNEGERHLGRMFLRHDLRKYRALVRFTDDEQTVSKAFLQRLDVSADDCDHIIAGWYGFHDIDLAVEIKLRAPSGTNIVIHAMEKDA